MALYLSEANLHLAGRDLVWGQEYDLPDGDPEVMGCVAQGYLRPRNADGSYAPAKVQPPRGCCGG